MKIGFVTTWLQRGATYVTINYIKLLQNEHKIFVYARGGEYYDENFVLSGVNVHKGLRLEGTEINEKDFYKWVTNNSIDIIIFNEQSALKVICSLKMKRPDIIIGTYIDYYKENMVADFQIYDFLICNTRRHMSVFNWHKQCLYLPWGVDTNLYTATMGLDDKYKVRFFHSMGMSNRKGTDTLIKVFYENNLHKLNAKLIIHTQIDIQNMLPSDYKSHNIEVIHKSVGAPGLYHLGDVYVYPCKLDGLGLTMYEALSCGLPVIATDVAPMNEIVNNQIGRLVSVKSSYSRSDGYYWPLSIVDETALVNAMTYYIDNSQSLLLFKEKARNYAVSQWDLQKRKPLLSNFINSVKSIDNNNLCKKLLSKLNNEEKSKKNHAFVNLFIPQKVESKIRENKEKKRI